MTYRLLTKIITFVSLALVSLAAIIKLIIKVDDPSIFLNPYSITLSVISAVIAVTKFVPLPWLRIVAKVIGSLLLVLIITTWIIQTMVDPNEASNILGGITDSLFLSGLLLMLALLPLPYLLRKREESLSFLESVIPIIFLILLLSVNVGIFGDDALAGSNQICLILAAAYAAVIAVPTGLKWDFLEKGIVKSISSAMGSMLILLLIGSLAGTWLLSGIELGQSFQELILVIKYLHCLIPLTWHLPWLEQIYSPISSTCFTPLYHQ